MLHDPGKIMLRWLATSNHELVYRGQVFLLDAYFDRGPRNRPTGIVPGEVKRTDATTPISITCRTQRRLHRRPRQGGGRGDHHRHRLQARRCGGSGHGGGGPGRLKFKGVTVDAALAQHSTLSRDALDSLGGLYDPDAGPAAPEQAEAEKAILARGTFSPDVITKGTIAYAFTFDTGLELVWIDSAGPVTDGVRALAQKLGPVDIAIVACQGHPVAQVQVPVTLELVKLFRPRIFMPAHHDQIFGTFIDLGVEPLFEAIADALPGTQTIAPLHQRPNCFDISKKRARR
jgi:hypothetical protein